MKGMQYKTFDFHIKAASEKDGIGTIQGYGSIFNNVDSYGDIVVKGAFTKSLNAARNGQIKMLWQHDSAMPIGTWSDLKEDDIGLAGSALLPLDIISIKEKYQMAKAGLVSGLSIGYMVRDGGYKFQEDGTCLLTDLDLREISLVTFPANPLSLVSDVKSKGGFSEQDVSDLLCGLGYQKQEAREIVRKFTNNEDLIDNELLAIKESIQGLSSTLKGMFKCQISAV